LTRDGAVATLALPTRPNGSRRDVSSPSPLPKPVRAARRRLLSGSAAVAAAWLAGPARSLANEASAPPLPAPGAPLRLPEVALLDGGTFRPTQADGRVLVVYWWASWCPFCAQQSPHVQALWDAHRARGLQVLGLSIDRSADAARDYLAKKGYTFPSGLVTPEVQRVLPKPKGLPVTLVRGRDGRVLQAERGQLFPEDVEALARWLG
jgi:thiol-disulfide isomerase/thioredoxin